jgi:hypothetical protein
VVVGLTATGIFVPLIVEAIRRRIATTIWVFVLLGIVIDSLEMAVKIGQK